jgi:hypothetical protein
MMPTAPTIQYLQLDPQYDPIFDSSANLTDAFAVNQAILTRLKLLLGEWWENTNLGLPLFQVILGQLGTQRGLAAMTLAVQQNIEGGPYVTGTSDISVTFTQGVLSITAKAYTQFGPVAISTAPALNAASLGT